MADAQDQTRDLDLALFGATGFTGGLTAEYLARNAPDGLRWALVGRNLGKLEQVRTHLATIEPGLADLELVVADTSDAAALAALARGETLDEAQLGDAFYDQSHLIREIKRFAGATPGQLGKPTLYTEATTTGRKQLAGKVSPIVSET